MRFTLVCVEGSEDLPSLQEAVNRRVDRPDFTTEILQKPSPQGSMGVLDEGLAFASDNPEVVKAALTAFLVWLEARFGRTSTWTVSNGKRTVTVETRKLDRQTREAIAELSRDEDGDEHEEETDRPGS